MVLPRPHTSRSKTLCSLHSSTPFSASQSILRIIRVDNPDFFKDREGCELGFEYHEGHGWSERKCHIRKPKGSGEDRDWLTSQDKGRDWVNQSGQESGEQNPGARQLGDMGWSAWAVRSEPNESKHWFCHFGAEKHWEIYLTSLNLSFSLLK